MTLLNNKLLDNVIYQCIVLIGIFTSFLLALVYRSTLTGRNVPLTIICVFVILVAILLSYIDKIIIEDNKDELQNTHIKVKNRYYYSDLLVIAMFLPCILQLFGAPELRFFIPIYVFAYAYVYMHIDFQE